MHNLKKWDIWWANVKYTDVAGEKIRPVLIYDKDTAYIISFKITSHLPRAQDDGDYFIKQWKLAGLNKPSTIRCSQIIPILDGDLFTKIGELQTIDIKEVRKILLKKYQFRD